MRMVMGKDQPQRPAVIAHSIKKPKKMKILETYPCVLSFHIYFVIVFGKQQLTTS